MSDTTLPAAVSATWIEWVRQLRLHQWSKNLLIAVPLIAAHEVTNWPLLGRTVAAFFAFSFIASAVYVVNDLLDLEADRAHQKKRHRPLAAGVISVRQAMLVAVGLVAAGTTLGLSLLPGLFTVLVLGYFALSLVYSVSLKRRTIIDVITLALFYAYRVIVGSVATGITCSPWLLAFSLFFFLSLALLKRYAELEFHGQHGEEPADARAYRLADAPILRSFGIGASMVSGLVVVLYLQSTDVLEQYRRPEWLWLVCPLVLAWSMRAWLYASRGEMHVDPVVFALKDKGSHLLALATLLLLVIAS